MDREEYQKSIFTGGVMEGSLDIAEFLEINVGLEVEQILLLIEIKEEEEI